MAKTAKLSRNETKTNRHIGVIKGTTADNQSSAPFVHIAAPMMNIKINFKHFYLRNFDVWCSRQFAFFSLGWTVFGGKYKLTFFLPNPLRLSVLLSLTLDVFITSHEHKKELKVHRVLIIAMHACRAGCVWTHVAGKIFTLKHAEIELKCEHSASCNQSAWNRRTGMHSNIESIHFLHELRSVKYSSTRFSFAFKIDTQKIVFVRNKKQTSEHKNCIFEVSLNENKFHWG